MVITALPARLLGVPYGSVSGHWTVILNLLAGSLTGAWLGATWATRMQSKTLHAKALRVQTSMKCRRQALFVLYHQDPHCSIIATNLNAR